MSHNQWRLFLGILLIGLGSINLLQVMGFIPGEGLIPSVLFGFLFTAGGAAFVSLFGRDREKWWALLPGVILIDIGLLVALGSFLPHGMNQFGGSFFLAGLGLAFWLVYTYSRNNWWAIIPGGVLFTLAVVAGVGENQWVDSGTILFFGLAVTFALVALLARMEWAWYPAAALLVIGVLVSFFTSSTVNYLWPSALIVMGIYLLARSLHKPAG